MSGNPDEMPADSTRLRDRATTAFQERRQQAADATDRLRDRATTAFQQRRQQAQQARDAVAEQQEAFASALGVGVSDVRPIQLDDRGNEIGFLPTDDGRSELVADFSSDRPFVEPTETLVEADPRDGVRTQVDPGEFDDVAARARRQTANGREFVESDDLVAEVGAGGVNDLRFASGAQRRVAARQFEADTNLTDVDPATDVRSTDDGFGLAEPAQRQLAASQLREQTPLTDVDPQTDLRTAGDGFGLDRRAQRRAAAERFESTTGFDDLGPTDVELANGEATLTRARQRELGARELDQQLPDQSVEPGDIELSQDGDGLEAVFDPGGQR